jgi:hypothetical protein
VPRFKYKNMSKVIRKSRTESFSFGNQPTSKLPSPEEVNTALAAVTKQEIQTVVAAPVPQAAQTYTQVPTYSPQPVVKIQAPLVIEEPVVKTPRRVPLTTAITPELRAKLEVATMQYDMNVSDLLHEALDLYFNKVRPVTDLAMLETFTAVYGRKAK